MEKEIKKSHQLKVPVPAPSQIVTGVLSNLNDISEKIASGDAIPEMLGRLENMQQMIAKLKGCEDLAKRAAALKGVIKTELLPELLELLQQDVKLNALVPLPKVKDDNIRSDGGKLVGLTGVVEGGRLSVSKRSALLPLNSKRSRISLGLSAYIWIQLV